MIKVQSDVSQRRLKFALRAGIQSISIVFKHSRLIKLTLVRPLLPWASLFANGRNDNTILQYSKRIQKAIL